MSVGGVYRRDLTARLDVDEGRFATAAKPKNGDHGPHPQSHKRRPNRKMVLSIVRPGGAAQA
jgi:hypothetical protein